MFIWEDHKSRDELKVEQITSTRQTKFEYVSLNIKIVFDEFYATLAS